MIGWKFFYQKFNNTQNYEKANLSSTGSCATLM